MRLFPQRHKWDTTAPRPGCQERWGKWEKLISRSIEMESERMERKGEKIGEMLWNTYTVFFFRVSIAQI